MTDYFALFKEQRRPWLDAELLKTKFLSFSSQVHPDRLHNASAEEQTAANQHYAELNAAYNVLREPKDRLLHLLELESGGRLKDVQRIPAGTMDLFMEVGQTCRDADVFIAERAKVTSPLLKVKMFEKAMEWTDRLAQLQKQVNVKRDALMSEVVTLDKLWDQAPPEESPERKAALQLGRLEEIYRALSYIVRWTGQIQERVVQVST